VEAKGAKGANGGVDTEWDGTGEPFTPSWSVSQIGQWCGISGPYDLMAAMPTMHARGLKLSVIKELTVDLQEFSPTRRVRDLGISDPMGVAKLLPRMRLYHGTKDDTVHWQQSATFAEALHAAGVTATCRFYKGKSHTDPILEDPLHGADPLTTELLGVIHRQTKLHSNNSLCDEQANINAKEDGDSSTQTQASGKHETEMKQAKTETGSAERPQLKRNDATEGDGSIRASTKNLFGWLNRHNSNVAGRKHNSSDDETNENSSSGADGGGAAVRKVVLLPRMVSEMQLKIARSLNPF